MNPFEALGLSDSATVTQVRAAWRSKVSRQGIHPDRGGSAEKLEALRDAYERALKIATEAPCIHCRGTGKIGSGETSFVKTLMLCVECGGTGKRVK